MTESTTPDPAASGLKPSAEEQERSSAMTARKRVERSVRQTSAGKSSSNRKRRPASRQPDANWPSTGKSVWLLPWRRAKAIWDYWKPRRSGSGRPRGSGSVVDSVLKLRETDFELQRDNVRTLVRTWPSRRTLCNPVWWINNAGLFGWRWLITRRYLPLLLATPAIVLAFGLIGAISAGSTISAGTHSMLYKRILAAGVEQVGLQHSTLAVAALMRIDPNNLSVVFDRALIEERSGNVDDAQLIMTELAQNAKSPDAALWLAERVGDLSQFASWSNQQKITYHSWLKIAASSAPDNPLPRRRMGQIRALVGNKQGAYEALLPIADTDLETSFLVYGLQTELGYTDLALARGEKLERAYKIKLQEDPLDLTARIPYASLLASLDRYSEAREILNQGLQYATSTADRLRLESAAAELLVAESAHLATTDPSPAGLIQRMKRLQHAAELAPQNRRVLEAVIEVCLAATDSKDEEQANLRESLIQDIDPDTSHFIRGTIALNQGNFDEATQHLELAAKNNSHMPGFLNNLAHAICYSETPDLERALQLANAANELQPDHPHLRETRGQIYLKLKRYSDAIADLEVALREPELRSQARAGLAEAYQALGQGEMAKRQRELAEEL